MHISAKKFLLLKGVTTMPNELKPMKAWLVREKDEFCATVVFAETRGKAKVVALSTDCCEDVDFCRIEVQRVPQIDKYYVDGKREMCWENLKDRLALVKECGFRCDRDYFCLDDCKICPATKYCDQYQDYIAEMEQEG